MRAYTSEVGEITGMEGGEGRERWGGREKRGIERERGGRERGGEGLLRLNTDASCLTNINVGINHKSTYITLHTIFRSVLSVVKNAYRIDVLKSVRTRPIMKIHEI